MMLWIVGDCAKAADTLDAYEVRTVSVEKDLLNSFRQNLRNKNYIGCDPRNPNMPLRKFFFGPTFFS